MVVALLARPLLVLLLACRSELLLPCAQVLAGPGTGKTRALTARMAYLVGMAKVPARRVLALTFTNKAARELRERMERLVGPERAEQITMGTYHSLCLAMLRQDIEAIGMPYRRGFAVYDEEDARKLTRDLLKQAGPSRAIPASRGSGLMLTTLARRRASSRPDRRPQRTR